MAIFLPLLTAFLIVAAPPEEAISLIEKNELSLAMIHSFRARIVSEESLDGGLTWKKTDVIQWIRSAGKDRVDYDFGLYYPSQNGFEKTLPRTFIHLNTPEWTREYGDVKLIELGIVDSVKYFAHRMSMKGPYFEGWIDKPRSLLPQGYAGDRASLLLLFGITHDLSLRDLSGLSKTLRVQEGYDVKGDPVSLLNHLNRGDGRNDYTVQLNPKYHFMISSVQMIDLAYLTTDMTWRVEEFQEPAAGIFIPKRTRRIIHRSEFPKGLIVVDHITITDVNAPIPDKDLILKFPAGSLVRNDRDKTFQIWGEGDKPALTVTTIAELGDPDAVRLINTRREKRSTWYDRNRLSIVVVITVTISALWFLIRRRASKRRANHSEDPQRSRLLY